MVLNVNIVKKYVTFYIFVMKPLKYSMTDQPFDGFRGWQKMKRIFRTKGLFQYKKGN